MVYRKRCVCTIFIFFDNCRLYIAGDFHHTTFMLNLKCMKKYNGFKSEENVVADNVIIEIRTDFCAMKKFHVDNFMTFNLQILIECNNN